MHSLEKNGKMNNLKHYKRGIGNQKIQKNNPKSKWNLGKIIDVIKEGDGVTRGYKIRNNKGYTIERPLQLVRDLEIKTSRTKAIGLRPKPMNTRK